MNATARDEVLSSMPASGGEAASLVESAMLLRWRAPELALLLADRAGAAAGKDLSTATRAEHLAVAALNRLGRHGEATHRLLPVLQHSDLPVELRHELQVELAHCAAALGEPGTALAALRPVLAAGDDAAPVLRGTALIAAAESAVALGRGDVVPNALGEADELFREDPYLDRDTALLLRATVKAVAAARHRRSGAVADCEAQARAGRELLAGLADPEHDSGQVSARLMLETALALLDRGAGEAAVHEIRPILRRPVRAAAAAAVGWLRLAIATRVHLAEGRHEPALGLLADAVEVSQRHGVDAVLAECLEGLSHVHEVRGEFADALHCLRSARAAERRHRRTIESARSALLDYCGVARREVPRLIDQIAGMLPGPGWLRAVPDPVAGLLDAEEYDCRVEAALTGSAGHSQVLLAVGFGAADEPPGCGLLVELSKRLRRAAPPGAALGQITVDRIAVLLTGMNRHQAQVWADRFRAAASAELHTALAVGVAQYRPGTGVDQFLADTVAALRRATEVPRSAPRPAESATGVRASPGPVPVRSVPADPGPADPVPPATTQLHPARPGPERSGPERSDPERSDPERSGLGWSTSARSGSVRPSPNPVVHGANPAPLSAPLPAPADSATPDTVVLEAVSEPAAGAAPPTDEPDPLDLALSDDPEPAPDTRRRRGNNGTPILVSDLLPRSVLSAGRTGRRRAEDRPEDWDRTDDIGIGENGDDRQVSEHRDGYPHRSEERAEHPLIAEARRTADGATAQHDPQTHRAHPQTGPMLSLAAFDHAVLSEPSVLDTGVNGSAGPDEPDGTWRLARELPADGPPPAPPPRTLEWSSNGSAAGKTDGADVGMGDLLAEALAAFQQSGHSLNSSGTDLTGVGTDEAAAGHDFRGARTTGVQLAPGPGERSGRGDAMTDPELRLPDLTAEPLWRPPGTGRRSAAGD